MPAAGKGNVKPGTSRDLRSGLGAVRAGGDLTRHDPRHGERLCEKGKYVGLDRAARFVEGVRLSTVVHRTVSSWGFRVVFWPSNLLLAFGGWTGLSAGPTLDERRCRLDRPVSRAVGQVHPPRRIGSCQRLLFLHPDDNYPCLPGRAYRIPGLYTGHHRRPPAGREPSRLGRQSVDRASPTPPGLHQSGSDLEPRQRDHPRPPPGPDPSQTGPGPVTGGPPPSTPRTRTRPDGTRSRGRGTSTLNKRSVEMISRSVSMRSGSAPLR
jgi:hypothetical protein